ncbi:MAG: 6-bladed beta-propeller, partial [Candidatus Aminicenantes bacterium]
MNNLNKRVKQIPYGLTNDEPAPRQKKMLVLIVSSFFLVGLAAAEVKNPDTPLKGDWDLKAKKIWEVSAYGKKVMAMPGVGAVLDDGTICVFDWRRKENYIFDSNGKFVASFGKKGEGPGEVRSQRNIFAGEGKFIIMDYFQIHYFLKNGKYLKTVRYTRTWGFPQLFIDDDEYLSLKSTDTFEIQWVNLTKGSYKSIKEISYYQGVSFAGKQGRMTIIIPGLTPGIECAFDQKNKKLYYGKNDSYTIYVMNQEGIVLNRFSIDRKKRYFTTGMKKELQKEIGLSPAQWKRFPGYLTEFNKIQIVDELVLVYVIYIGDYWHEQ